MGVPEFEAVADTPQCQRCGGLMVPDRYDPGERSCSSCGRSTFVPNPAEYRSRGGEGSRRAPRGPSMPQGTLSVRKFK